MNLEEITAAINCIVPTMRSAGFTIQTASGLLVVPPGREADQIADLLEHQQRLALICAQCTADPVYGAPVTAHTSPAAAESLTATAIDAVASAQPTANEIKHRLRQQGQTLKSFAAAHGFQYRTVSDVVRGLRQGNFGEGREVREKLGLKPDRS